MEFFLLAGAGLALTVILHHIALQLFPALGLLDFPERYGLKRRRLPYPTGILAVAAFIVIFLSIFPPGLKESGLIIGCLCLAVISFVDDRHPLPPALRLSIQLLVCLLIFASGSRIYTLTSPAGGILKLDATIISTPLFGTLPVLSGLFTVLWLMLTINAMNWLDGIPGQVTTLSAIGFLMLGLLALLRDAQPQVALLSFLLCGIALGCAVFDFPPNRVVIGDSGSMFFGLMLGVIGVYNGGKVATVFLALAVPLIDAFFVVTRRMMAGRSPLKGGRDHLHHELLQAGLGERAIIALVTLFGGGLATLALFMNTPEKVSMMIIIGLVLLWIKISASGKT